MQNNNTTKQDQVSADEIKRRARLAVESVELYDEETRNTISGKLEHVLEGEANHGHARQSDLDALSHMLTMIDAGATGAQIAAYADQIEDSRQTQGESESAECAELRERVAELEQELEIAKRPWEVQHDFRGQRSGEGRRRGKSNVDELRDALEIQQAARFFADDAGGPTHIGALIVVIEHFAALAFRKKFNALDMAIDDFRETLFKHSGYWQIGLDPLREQAVDALRRLVTDHATDELSTLAQDLANFNREYYQREHEGSDHD